MALQALVGSQALCVFVLLATAASAMLLDEISSQPVATSGAADSPALGSPPGGPSYQEGQSQNVYSYPAGNKFPSYTYGGDHSSQYGSDNANNGFSSSYQGAGGVPQYVSTFRGFTKMAVAKPYTYYVAHPGETSGLTYQGARSDVSEHPGNDYTADNSLNVDSVKAVNPTDTGSLSGKRSLLDFISHQDSAPAQNSLFSSLASHNLLNNARIQISFSGGYPSNAPRYTYLTLIIPGDLCTQTASGLVTGASQQDSLPLGNQMNGFVNNQIPYSTNLNTYDIPTVSATGYGTSDQYHYSGTDHNQAMYGQAVYGSLPVGQTYAANGGGFLNTLQHGAALRSLDDHEKNPEDPKPPAASPSVPPASGNAKPNENPPFAAASRSIST